eukprot:418389-Rhodomonas_salina.1
MLTANAKKKRTKLTSAEVLEIFSRRSNINNYESNVTTSRQLALQYHISERTVRDIWSRRTRKDVTQNEWTLEEHRTQNKRTIGRPLGAKDGGPRKPHRRLQASSPRSSESFSQTTSIARADP